MTAVAAKMLDLRPGAAQFDAQQLSNCIEACFECVQACAACADACLGEDTVAALRRCVATNLSCADLCSATGQMLSRLVGYDANVRRRALEACLAACRSCGEECERHAAMHEHCRVCAEVCHRCENACAVLLATEEGAAFMSPRSVVG